MGSMTTQVSSGHFEHIKDSYAQIGFRPLARVRPHPSDPQGRIITLIRRGKKGPLRSLRSTQLQPLRSACAADPRCRLRLLEDLA